MQPDEYAYKSKRNHATHAHCEIQRVREGDEKMRQSRRNQRKGEDGTAELCFHIYGLIKLWKSWENSIQEKTEDKNRRNQNMQMTQLKCFVKVIVFSWFSYKFHAVKGWIAGEGLACVYNAISHTDKAGKINQLYDHLLSSSSRGNEGNICTVSSVQISKRQTGERWQRVLYIFIHWKPPHTQAQYQQGYPVRFE